MPEAEPASGTPVLPGFSNLTRIGVGGFSVVYRARQDALGREVALKVMAVDLSEPRAAERFRRECEMAGSLSDHPSIVTVYDAGVAPDGRPWLAMELCEEGSLADRIRVRGPMSPEEVMRIGIQVAGALEAAHGAGVLHRDVKPENILVRRSGDPALADFGISVIAEQRDAAFTQAFSVAHAAPEVLEGAAPSPAADVYGLGSALWMLLAGRPAFEAGAGEGMLPFLRRVATESVPPLGRGDVPPMLEVAIGAAMAKEPSDRLPSVGSLAAALRDVQQHVGVAQADVEPRRAPPAFLGSVTAPERVVAPPDLATIIKPGLGVGEPVGAEDRSRRGRTAWVVAAAGVVVLAGVILSTTLRGSGTATSAALTSSTSPVSVGPGSQAPPSTVADLPAPSGLEAAVTGPTTVDLRWQAPSVGNPAYTVTIKPTVGSAPATVPRGQTSLTVGGLSTSTTGYCFVVSAVYLLRDGTARVVPSDAVCTLQRP